MDSKLHFFNWSLKKTLETENSDFIKARIRILYLIILMTLLKVAVVIFFSTYFDQDFQFWRAVVLGLFYLFALKLLLYNKYYIKSITHSMLVLALLVIWSSIFITGQSINIINLQFIFMVTISSFYLLNINWGFIYSSIASLPALLILIFQNTHWIEFSFPPQLLIFPANIILMVLNFITIVFANYMYHKAFNINMNEKDALNIQLNKTALEAKKLAYSKSNFLSTISHELRTPLNSVIGITDLILTNPYNDEQKENLKILKFSGLSLLALINNVLDFNKIESEKVYLESTSINLNELIQNIYIGFVPQAKAKGIEYTIHVDDTLKSKTIISDPTRLTQIIYNIVGNSIKFTPKGAVSIRVEEISKSEEYSLVRFIISDTGIGIASERLTQIFEPFVQASSNITRNFGGTGLGLSIVKNLLLLFNSEINIESNLGQGSTFSFDIHFDLDKQTYTNQPEDTGITHNLNGLNILIAEDNPINIYLMRQLCQRWNITSTIAENGKEVLAKIETNSYHAILMDIHMPEMDGYETTKHIRSMKDPSKSNIPIIALTATSGDDVEKIVYAVGMNDYILKPFQAAELFKKLQIISETLSSKL